MKNEVMAFFGTKCGLAIEKAELPPPRPLDCIVSRSTDLGGFKLLPRELELEEMKAPNINISSFSLLSHE